MSNEIKTILSIVPQSYYDLIAKFIPGVVATQVPFILYYRNLAIPKNIWEIFFGLITIYIVGLCLDIGSLTFSLKPDRIRKDIFHKKDISFNVIEDLHDELHKVADIQDVNVIIKMLAETVLFRSLALFFCLLFFFDISRLISFYKFIKFQPIFFLLIAMIFGFLRVILQHETTLRIDSMPKLEPRSKR